MPTSKYRNVLVTAAAVVIGAISFTHAEDARHEWKAPSRASSLKNPIPANDKALAAGKAVYAKECASCHGNLGKGDGPDANDLSRTPPDFNASTPAQSDGEIFWKITEGKKPMPRYSKLLSDEDRWNTVNYIRSISKKAQ